MGLNSRVGFYLICAVFFIVTLSPVIDLLPSGTDTATIISLSVLIIWAGGAVFSIIMGLINLGR